MAESAERQQWFGTRSSGAFGPLAWQGRAALALYLVLVAFAIILYSDITLIVGVVILYTVILGLVVFVTSDLKDRFPKPE